MAFRTDDGPAASSNKMNMDQVRGEDKKGITFWWVEVGAAKWKKDLTV